MKDQDKLNLIQKYRNNPVVYVEDMHPEIKLHEYQKTILNAVSLKNKTISFINARMNQKRWLGKNEIRMDESNENEFSGMESKGD